MAGLICFGLKRPTMATKTEILETDSVGKG
jgi:hypothetical protein